MTIDLSMVPDGASHEPDLSQFSPDELRKYHTKALRRVAVCEGSNGVQAYKARHPETANFTVKPKGADVFLAKPTGYYDAVAALAGGWFTDPAALAQTNRQDVDGLNAALGCKRFDPDRFFSKPISKTVKERLTGVFAARGHILPETVASLSQAKQAAKSAIAGTLPDARPFGTFGTIAGTTLTLGTSTFRIEQHHGRDSIRVTAEGTTQRLYLSTVRDLLAGMPCQEQAGPPLPIYKIAGELARTPETAPEHDDPLEDWASSPRGPNDGGQVPPGAPSEDAPLSLYQRIARLAPPHDQPAPAHPTGADPLEL